MKKRIVSLILVLLFGTSAATSQTPEIWVEGRPRTIALAQPNVAPGTASVNLPAPQEPVQLRVLVGKSVVLNSPQILRRVSVSDPTIAAAVTISPTQVLLNGLTAGKTSLILWNEQDRPTAYDLNVELDVVGLRDTIAQIFPGENI